MLPLCASVDPSPEVDRSAAAGLRNPRETDLCGLRLLTADAAGYGVSV